MFTGLIQTMGMIRERLDQPGSSRLVVDAGNWQVRPRVGDSIAVNGCCLTVADTGPHHLLFFDVVPQTLARTTLGKAHPGHRVNLEAAATPQTLLGGHIVQGHVDGIGRITRVDRAGEYRIFVQCEPELMQYMTPRGSVALDGVSLTLAEVDPKTDTFQIALIPTTLKETTLGELVEGDSVNIEADALAKTIVHWLGHYAGRLG
ncbi:MAG: riboflavin synthase [Phycisphaerales bacterium]